MTTEADVVTATIIQTFPPCEDDVDQQIENLLREAEQRMRSAATAADAQTNHQSGLEAVGENVFGEDALKTPRFKLPQLKSQHLPEPYVRAVGGIARLDPSRLVDPKERQSANGLRKVNDPIMMKEKLKMEKVATAGPKWFDLPRTNLTPELKRDLQLLQMRSVLDPKRHYKKEGKKSSTPQYSQVGTVIEGPTEFFSGRIPNKERKKTFVQEVLANAEARDGFKRKYAAVQAAKTSGKKAYYRQLQAKRAKKRK